jgi:hypothetical protein
VKPAAGSFERVFLGQLLEPVIVETVKGRNRFSNDKPGIRYFSPSSDFPGTYAHDPGTVKTVSAFAIYGRVDGHTNVVLAADGLLDSFEVADDELDRMEGIINEECAPDSGEEAENEENKALERHRRSEAQANMFRADGDEQVFAAGHKRVRMEPVRLSDQARYQELRGKDSNKSYTT